MYIYMYMFMILFVGYMVIIHLNVMLKAIILGHQGTTSHGHFSLSLSPWQILDLHSWQVEVLNYPAK